MDEQIPNQTSFSGWAKVEINGHNTHIGMVTTQVFGTACLFRIDQPEIPADEQVTKRDGYIDGRRVPAGTTVKRGAIPAATVLVGAGSIYRITPCTEAAALKAIEQSVSRPLIPVGLPDELALPPAENEDDDDVEIRENDDEEEDEEEDSEEDENYPEEDLYQRSRY